MKWIDSTSQDTNLNTNFKMKIKYLYYIPTPEANLAQKIRIPRTSIIIKCAQFLQRPMPPKIKPTAQV